MSDANTIDINAEVQSALPAVLERMRQNIAERVTREAEAVAMEEVRKAVREWTVAHLVPEIQAQMAAGKEAMVAEAAQIAQRIGQAIGTALQEQAEKTLASSYTVKDIAEKLFRGY